LTNASANACRASLHEWKPWFPPLWISQSFDSENLLIPSPVHVGWKSRFPRKRLMTYWGERPEKNTGRATRQRHMSRRAGTVCLSASISSSAHRRLIVGSSSAHRRLIVGSSSAHRRLIISSPSVACIITTTFLLWQIACLFRSEPIEVC
jgi:hypothetical protein